MPNVPKTRMHIRLKPQAGLVAFKELLHDSYDIPRDQIMELPGLHSLVLVLDDAQVATLDGRPEIAFMMAERGIGGDRSGSA